MDLLVELSGEHPTLPAAELEAAFAAVGWPVERLGEDADLLLVRTAAPEPVVPFVAARLGLTHQLHHHLVSGSLTDVRAALEQLDLGGATTALRVARLRGLQPHLEPERLAKELGGILGRTGRISLEAPEVEVRLLLASECHLGIVLAKVNRSQFESRKTPELPFQAPVAFHPRLARALVNLARIPPGGTAFDPFCGIGGLLTEAALLGYRVVGGDLRADMVEGSQRNLAHLGLEAALRIGDVAETTAEIGLVDGIVTDPPYGRSTTTGGEPKERLYARAFTAFSQQLPAGARVAIAFPERGDAIERPGFCLCEHHELRVHRSLTRHLCVYEQLAGEATGPP